MPIIAADDTVLPAAILTPRLRLRPLAEKDLDQLVTLIGDWEVARWLARVPHPYGAEDARKFIGEVGRRMAQMRELHYGIALRDEDLLIGGMGLVAGDQSDELGYWIGRPYWGRGYAGEAVPPLLSLAFNRLQRTRVFARILPDNHASRRLLEKLGFSYEGDRLTHFPIRARDMMLPHYEMTSALWQARYGTESPTGEDE
ncbi:MAG TPA: GNAT family N-acetyltransferase [Sphingomonadales bacterium]